MSSITETEILDYDIFKTITHQSCPYEKSNFRFIKNLSSKKKGAIFEKIFEEYMISNGHTIEKSKSSDHDRIVNGHKVEIKGSFLWENGKFRFQQIRVNQDYDYIVFLAIYPEFIEFYIASKETTKEFLCVQDENGFWPYNQHGGKKTKSGTFYIDCFPNEIHWMEVLTDQLNDQSLEK